MGTSRDGKRRGLTFGSDGSHSTDKLRELILYVADKCEDDPTSYRKFQQGPVPTILKRVRFEMEESGEVVVRKKSYHGRMQHRIIPLRQPDFSLLGARDIALVDDMIRMFWDRSAQEVSELSHDRAWKNASEGEPIPYEAAFVSDEPLTERDAAIAEEMIAEYERFEQSAGRS
jgi:hypothetical protein